MLLFFCTKTVSDGRHSCRACAQLWYIFVLNIGLLPEETLCGGHEGGELGVVGAQDQPPRQHETKNKKYWWQLATYSYNLITS